MSNKGLSNKSGLYGESIYPPMFDTEPPPLGDEDGDPNDDDFADFTSFQNTGTDDSNWSSWSNWSGSADVPGKVQEFGTFDNFFEQKSSSEEVSQSGKGPNSPVNQRESVTSYNSEEVSHFGAFSKTPIKDTVFNGEIGDSFQNSDLVVHRSNSTMGQSHNNIGDQSQERLSSNIGDYQENSSTVDLTKVTSPSIETDSKSISSVLQANFESEISGTIVNKGSFEVDIEQENFHDTEISFEKEDEFDDFADFQSNENKDDFFSNSVDKLSSDYDKIAQGEFVHGSDDKLQNGFVKVQGDLEKEDAPFDSSNMESKSGKFVADFGTMNESTEVEYAFDGKMSGVRDIERCGDERLSVDKVSNSIEGNELDIHKGVEKTDCISNNCIGSDMNYKSHDKNLLNPLKEEIIISPDSQSQNIFGNNLEEFKAFSANENEIVERSLFDKDENTIPEDAIGIQSAFVGQDSSHKVSDSSGRDVMANGRSIDLDISEEVRNGSIGMNSSENVSISEKDSSISNEGLSSRGYLPQKENFVGNVVAPQTYDFSNGDDFDDFQGTNRSESIPDNKDKETFVTNKNIASKENDTCLKSNSEDFHQAELLEKSPIRHVESPNMDLFANMESSSKLDHVQNEDEFDDFHSFSGTDMSVVKVDSSLVQEGATETKYSSCNSFNEKMHDASKSEDEYSDFKNFDKAVLSEDTTHESIKCLDADTGHLSNSVNVSDRKDDDFDDFQDFSTSVDDSVAKKPGDSYKEDMICNEGNTFESGRQDATDDQWANFSSAEKVEPSENAVGDNFGEFAAFPVDSKQGDDDNNWASFGAHQSERSSQSTHFENEKQHTAGNEFGSLSAAKTAGVLQSNKPDSSHEQVHRNSTIPLLLAPCFPKRGTVLQSVGSYNCSRIEKFLQDDRDQELHGIWGKLSGKEDAEDAWKLSYTSSTSFNWLLQSVNVAYEKITKKYTHSSRDTLSSLSPASSVASFDMEISGDQILVPEPVTRFSSLLKPTLLAQSQQKELDLQSVPSVSSLRKGENGSDSTSETNSLDLEFFSGTGTATPVSSNLTGSSSSLNNIELRDIALTADSSTGKAESQSSKQPHLPPRSGKGSTSLPFNLGSLSNTAVKEEISKEARQFLEEIENLRFMSSTVLLFPSQFSSNE